MRQWSSTDSSGYSTDGSSRLRVNVTKASSFHGVTVLSRADSSATSTGGYYMSKTGVAFVSLTAGFVFIIILISHHLGPQFTIECRILSRATKFARFCGISPSFRRILQNSLLANDFSWYVHKNTVLGSKFWGVSSQIF